MLLEDIISNKRQEVEIPSFKSTVIPKYIHPNNIYAEKDEQMDIKLCITVLCHKKSGLLIVSELI